MKKLTLLIAAVVGAVLVAGVAAAAPGFGAQADDRPMDGTNSPWTNSDDPRLERFQERYDLTDAEMEQVRAAVQETVLNGGDRTAIRAAVTEQLSEFGIDDPELGPVEGFGPHDAARNNGPGQGQGANGHGPGAGHGQTLRDGSGVGTGPHGNGGDCGA